MNNAAAIAAGVIGVAIFGALFGLLLFTDIGNQLIDSAQRCAVGIRRPGASSAAPIVFQAWDAICGLVGWK